MNSIEEVVIPIIAIIGFFAAIIVWVYLFFSSRNKIRMALIQTGKDSSIFKKGQNKLEALKFGIVSVMIGLGILLASLLEKTGMPGVVAYFSMILILGGAGLVGFYWYAVKKHGPDELV